jgi:hypothetical protein
MKTIAFLALLLLAACGADGEPEPVGDTGVAVSGEARIGVTGGL